MTARVVPHTFTTLQQEWERLLSGAAINTLFLTPYWQRIWWDAFDRDDDPLLLAFQDDDDLLGIAPLMRERTTLSFLGATDLFDYHDFIVPQGREDAFYPSLIEYLTSQEWSSILLTSLPEESPTVHRLPDLARAQGWSCEIEQEDVAPGIILPQDWDSYLSGLSKKDRHELRRKFRRLSSVEDVVLHAFSEPQDVRAHLDDFFLLMQESREEKRDFLTPERREFFQSMAEDLSARGMLQLYFMDIGGSPVAAAICFDYQGQRLLYNSGFNPDHASLSVGLLLNAHTLGDAIKHGGRYFDFLRGDEPYKYHLGATDRRIYRLTITR